MIALLLVGLSSAQGPVTYEDLKAAFVVRFTRHVEWPADALPPDATFVACIVGDDPIASRLERLAEERTVKDRPLEARRLGPTDPTDGCHLVWISRSARRVVDTIVAGARSRPVLLIGDTDGFVERGVHLELWLDGDQVRFDANAAAARASGLEVSSQLLRYARIVGDGEAP